MFTFFDVLHETKQKNINEESAVWTVNHLCPQNQKSLKSTLRVILRNILMISDCVCKIQRHCLNKLLSIHSWTFMKSQLSLYKNVN